MDPGGNRASGAARLGIGTVQFGLDYGVTNRSGKVGRDEVSSILHFAWQQGVRLLDTAALYGDSEAAIGAASAGLAFDVVTKTVKVGDAPDAASAVAAIGRGFDKSLSDLRTERVHALMVHDAGDLTGPFGDEVWKGLEAIRASGRAGRIGASVYGGEQLDLLLDRYELEIVQIPINALDTRLEEGGQLARLAARGVEVHARSIFLQGILLSTPEDLPEKLAGLAPALTAMRESFTRAGLTVMEGLVASVFRHQMIDRVIVGAASLREFREIVSVASRLELIESDPDPGHWTVADHRLLNPALWGTL